MECIVEGGEILMSELKEEIPETTLLHLYTKKKNDQMLIRLEIPVQSLLIVGSMLGMGMLESMVDPTDPGSKIKLGIAIDQILKKIIGMFDKPV
jgi:hypothetical protein